MAQDNQEVKRGLEASHLSSNQSSFAQPIPVPAIVISYAGTVETAVTENDKIAFDLSNSNLDPNNTDNTDNTDNENNKVDELLRKADAFLEAGCHKEGLQTLEEALSLAIDNRTRRIIQIAIAHTFRTLRRFDQAVAQYKVILKPYGPMDNQPKEVVESLVPIFMGLAFSYLALQDYKSAIEFCNTILKKNPGYSPACQLMGDIHSSHCRFEDAIRYYSNMIIMKTAEGSDRNWINASYDRGRAYFHLGQYQNAVKDFKTVLSVYPKDEDAQYWSGISYYMLKDYPAALSCFKEITERNPKWVDACAYQAAIHCDLNEFEKAVQRYQSILAIDSTSSLAKVGLKGIAEKICSSPLIDQYEIYCKKTGKTYMINKLDPNMDLDSHNGSVVALSATVKK